MPKPMMDFSEALNVLKAGGTIRREAWAAGQSEKRIVLGLDSDSNPHAVAILKSRRVPWTVTDRDLFAKDWLATTKAVETVMDPPASPISNVTSTSGPHPSSPDSKDA